MAIKFSETFVNASHPHVLRPFYKIWIGRSGRGSQHSSPHLCSRCKRSTPCPALFPWRRLGHRKHRLVWQGLHQYGKDHRSHRRVGGLSAGTGTQIPGSSGRLLSCCKEIFAHCDMFGNTPDDITLIGDSAGGNLAASFLWWHGIAGSFSQNARFFYILPPTTTTPKIHRLSRAHQWKRISVDQ